MDIRQLRYFQAIAEEGQISKAAKRLHMAQPPLSQQLKMLETELGAKLLERGPRKILLTAAGRLLQERSAQLLELLTTTIGEIRDLDAGSCGTLSIGTVASSGAAFLPELILRFHTRFPEVRFHVWEGDTPRILELLQTGSIELGIVRAIYDPNQYRAHALPPEKMVLAECGPKKDAPEIQEASVQELAERSLLVHRSNEAALVECCRKRGFAPRILCRGDDVRSLLSWADAGIGCAVVPQSAVGLVVGGNLIYRTLREPALEIKKAVVWSRNRHLSAIAKNFLEPVLSTHFQSLASLSPSAI